MRVTGDVQIRAHGTRERRHISHRRHRQRPSSTKARKVRSREGDNDLAEGTSVKATRLLRASPRRTLPRRGVSYMDEASERPEAIPARSERAGGDASDSRAERSAGEATRGVVARTTSGWHPKRCPVRAAGPQRTRSSRGPMERVQVSTRTCSSVRDAAAQRSSRGLSLRWATATMTRRMTRTATARLFRAAIRGRGAKPRRETPAVPVERPATRRRSSKPPSSGCDRELGARRGIRACPSGACVRVGYSRRYAQNVYNRANALLAAGWIDDGGDDACGLRRSKRARDEPDADID